MYTTNLEELVMNRHKLNGANQLIILGGWVSFAPIEKISVENLETKIIYGCMKNANLTEVAHNKYVSLHSTKNNTEIFYKNTYNHSKIYCWLKDANVIDVLAGSANFSVSGLTNDYQETLYDISTKDYRETLAYLNDAIADSDPCDKHLFKPSAKSARSDSIPSASKSLDKVLSYNPPRAQLSLRSGRGTFQDSGINVGQKSLTGSHVHIDDCYVPIRASLIDQIPQLFPNNGINTKVGTGYGKAAKKINGNAEFLFDDGTVMQISFEQKGPARPNGHLYKAFRSFSPNKALGEYLRKRMGILPGMPFTEADFNRYGRDSIVLEKIAEGQYFVDFSVN